MGIDVVNNIALSCTGNGSQELDYHEIRFIEILETLAGHVYNSMYN